MSFLLDKSKQNKEAFFYLMDKSVNAAAVHCCYYSCIQKIIYILEEWYTVEYKAEVTNVKGGKGNMHKMYIDLISEKVSKDRMKQRSLRRNLVELRSARLEADYKNIEITDEKIDLIKDHFHQINIEIKRGFSL